MEKNIKGEKTKEGMQYWIKGKCLEIDHLIQGTDDDKLSLLTDREKKVLETRAGLDGKYYTLREIGQTMGGMTRQGVWAIQQRAVEKLRGKRKRFW